MDKDTPAVGTVQRLRALKSLKESEGWGNTLPFHRVAAKNCGHFYSVP